MNSVFKKFKFPLILAICCLTSVAYGEETFTVGVTGIPENLHPLEESAESERFLQHLLYTPLVINQSGKGWSCGACTELPSFKNKMTATVAKGKYQLLKTIWRLDKNLRWGDGVPVTAEDFVLAWDIIRTMRAEDRTAWPELAEVYDVEAGGHSRELIIWFGGKTPDFAHLLRFFPVPNHLEREIWEAAEKVPRDYFARTKLKYQNPPKGAFNGPFTFNTKADKQLYLFANEHRLPKAKLNQLRLILFDSFGSLAWAVRNNVVHLVPEDQISYGPLIELQKQLKTKDTKSTYHFRYEETGQLQVLAFNLRNPLLSDVALRLALSYGTDRKQLVQNVFARTKVFSDDWPVTFTGAAGPVGWRFDFARVKAEQVLNDLGWKLPTQAGADPVRTRDGEPLSFEIVIEDSSEVRQRIAEELRSQWQELGIELKIQLVEPSKFRNVVLPRASFRDLCLVSFDLQPDSSPRSFLHGKSIPSFENNYAGQNLMGWHDRETDEAIEAWDDAYLDETKRQTAQQTVLQRIQAEIPFLPLFRVSAGAVLDARVSGFTIGDYWGPSSQHAHLWQWSNTTAVKP